MNTQTIHTHVKAALSVFFACAVFILCAVPVFAQQEASVTPATQSATPTPVEYPLPYPGILSSHPLYIFKTLRDRIIEWLITDPVQKGDFYILQADKKLQMGLVLKDTGHDDDAANAFREAQESRLKAADIFATQKSEGNEVPPYLIEKLSRSLLKHVEVLEGMPQELEKLHDLELKVQQVSL